MSRAVAIIFAGAVAIASPAAGALTQPRGGPAPASGRVARAGMCYAGIAGSLQKDQCVTTAKYSSKLAELGAEQPSPECYARQQYHSACRENHRSAGGDESCTEQTTKADCEAVPGGADPDEPTIDGSDRKCFWFPPRDDDNKGQLCGSARSPHFDDKCVARHNDPSAGTCSGEIDEATKAAMPMHESQICSDRGSNCLHFNYMNEECDTHDEEDACNGAEGCGWDDESDQCIDVPSGVQKATGCTWEPRFESWTDVSCFTSDESSAAQNTFASMLGVECENRLKDGCRARGDERDDEHGCPDFSDATSCMDHGPEDEECSGTCMLADGDSLHANIASSPSWQGGLSCGDQTSQDSCEYYEPSCSFMSGNQAGCEDIVGCSYDSGTEMCMEGEKPMCHMLSDQDACTNTAGCMYRSDWSMCTNAMVATGCTWKKQCCQWIPPVGNSNADKEDACSTSGAGTEAGLCEVEYAEPGELPSARTVAMGFKYGLFRLGPEAFSSNTGCAMIATFVNGKGAGVALGADAANLMGKACHTDNVVNSDFCDDDDGAKELELKGVEPWMCVAEHIDMTVQEVESYCDNYAGIGNNEAMQAFERYTVHQLIEMANKGTLGDMVASWEGLKYIVARKDGIDGRCLLIGPKDMSYGVAACTCDSAGCNGQDAIGALIDPTNGPMRLFQFLDGSLDSLKDEINAAVPGILGSDGTINMDKVKDLTPNNIADFMAVAGVSDLTSTEELQGLINDIKAMADGSNLKTDGGTGGGTGGGVHLQNEEQGTVQQQNQGQGMVEQQNQGGITGSATTTTTIAAEESAAVEVVAGVAGAAVAVATLLFI